MWTPDPKVVTADQTPSGDLTRARNAAKQAERTLRLVQARRPEVIAAGQALERVTTRNHLAELVHKALGSGS